ncbi:hypothetical protein [Polyangium mundeleinium]|uniref:Lipoprotein n=1 Tax=Polyangium mundeleinium TaxID=2995306 RepID=A0ABT5EV17_9BACT|nr:hypothetical protein [Polyangium mundeleinium]MDC0744625.1 hypothetical protein [Polyangium mundeleinium]
MRALAATPLLISLAVLLPACAGYTSEARRAEIFDEITKTNQENRGRALTATLQARGATVLPAEPETLVVHDLERCLSAYGGLTPTPPETFEIQRVRGRKLVAPCQAFADGFAVGAAEATTEDGKRVLVIRAGRDELFALATTAAGKLLVLRPRREVVERRVVRIPGTCNRMPHPEPTFMPTEHAYVLEGRGVDSVEYLDVPYEGLDEDVRCDETTY